MDRTELISIMVCILLPDVPRSSRREEEAVELATRLYYKSVDHLEKEAERRARVPFQVPQEHKE
jgi:hypothetical protein